MIASVLLDAAGRLDRRRPCPGFTAAAPRDKGLRYPADPPAVEEIVAVIRVAGGTAHGRGPERGYGREHRELRKRFGLVVAVGAAVCARCGRFIDPREPSDSVTTTSIGLGSPDRSIDGATARRLVVRGGESRGGRGDEREHQGGRHGRPEHQRRNRTSRRLLRDTRTGRQSRSIIRASRAAWGGESRALTPVLLASLGVKLAVAARARCPSGELVSEAAVPNRTAVGAAHRVARQCRGRAAPPLALTALGDRPYDRHDPAPWERLGAGTISLETCTAT